MILTEQLHLSNLAAIHKGSWNNEQVAIKMLRGGLTPAAVALLEKDLVILADICHPRVSVLLGICKDLAPSEGSVGLVTEFMPRGSLFSCLHQQGEGKYPATLADKLRCALDIADGMRFLHAAQVVHGNLKSASILIDGDGRCKINGFGLSSFVSAVSGTTGSAALPFSAAWTAPEVLQDGSTLVEESTDVYSFGVILWELFREQLPWEGVSIAQLVVAGRGLPMPSLEADLHYFPLAVRNMILLATAKEAVSRSLFEQIQHQLRKELLELKRVQQALMSKKCPVPLLCPITMELMQDPVLCADGRSYERAAIVAWMKYSKLSPVTNDRLSNRKLTSNVALHAVIAGYRAALLDETAAGTMDVQQPGGSSQRVTGRKRRCNGL